MEIKIHSVRFDADQKLIDFVNAKVGKLPQFFDHIISAEVYLRLDKNEKTENKIAEIMLKVPNVKDIFAKRQTKSFEESIDQTVEAIRVQLLKHKEKLRGL